MTDREEKIVAQIAAVMAHPGGAAGMMADDERKLGATIVAVGSVEPFAVPNEDWIAPAVISVLDGEARIVAILAKRPGTGAFTRLLKSIRCAGLTPVIVEPMGNVMPRLMRKWGWQRTIVEGIAEEWRPAIAKAESA